MADPFLGELRLFPFNFAPTGWAFAAGQLLPISQMTALFALLGTMYGGNGTSTFQLPNLHDSCAMGAGQGPGLAYRSQGESGGEASVTLLETGIPLHTHQAMADVGLANQTTPLANAFAKASPSIGMVYNNSTSNLVAMNVGSCAPNGSSQPHNNMMPFLALNWCIALQGIFPQRP